MVIKVNGESVEIEEGSTLKDFSLLRQLPDKGIAIAVNENMITRSDWETCTLKDGDNLMIIRAVCGG